MNLSIVSFKSVTVEWSDFYPDGSTDILNIISTVNYILLDSCSICSDFNEDQDIDILDVIFMDNLIINFWYDFFKIENSV